MDRYLFAVYLELNVLRKKHLGSGTKIFPNRLISTSIPFSDDAYESRQERSGVLLGKIIWKKKCRNCLNQFELEQCGKQGSELTCKRAASYENGIITSMRKQRRRSASQ